jgi:hypothetical protein
MWPLADLMPVDASAFFSQSNDFGSFQGGAYRKELGVWWQYAGCRRFCAALRRASSQASAQIAKIWCLPRHWLDKSASRRQRTLPKVAIGQKRTMAA